MIVSSANISIEQSDTNKGRSSVKRINKRGTSIQPCGSLMCNHQTLQTETCFANMR